jgi:hypothetical protein
MTPFMLGGASPTHDKTPPIYDLYATVNHCGAVYMGHYIAQVKPPLSGPAAQDKSEQNTDWHGLRLLTSVVSGY